MKDLTPLLNKLADKLGTTATHLWAVLTQQAHVNSVIWISVFFVLLALSVASLWGWLKLGKKYNWDVDKNAFIVINGTIFFVSLAMTVAVFFVNVSDVVTGFTNPQYWAFEQVMSIIQRGN